MNESNIKGNIGLANAIKYFAENEYCVSIPLTDTAKYDLIVEKEGILQKVQCKYCNTKQKYEGIFTVPLVVCGGNRSRGNYKIAYKSGDFDLLFITTGNNKLYLIPFSAVEGNRTICVGRNSNRSKYEHFCVS